MDDVNQNQASALVLKRKAAWDDIRLEHCKLRTGELPAHRHREHVVLISLSDGCKGELITLRGCSEDLPAPLHTPTASRSATDSSKISQS